MNAPHQRRRRVLLSMSGALLVMAAFVFGFLAGRVGRADRTGGGLVAEAAERLRANAARELSQDELEEAAIRGMVDALGDKYAEYYDTTDFAQFQRLLEGRYTGVGLWLGRVKSGDVEVTSVVPDSPAEHAGLQVGDVLVDVGGRPVDGMEVGDVVRRMTGQAGTTVAVTVRRDGVIHTVTLRRADLISKDVTHDVVLRDVGRIRVTAFTRGTGREVEAALRALRAKKVTGVVLDLRGNPGGLLDEGVQVASVFLRGGTVVSYRGRVVEEKRYDVIGTSGDVTTPLVVLVDSGTGSAAEVVAGALQDRNRAIVMGTQTYGKGSVQQPLVLSDGSAIEVTVAAYYTPSGRSVDKVGIIPDVPLPDGYGASEGLRRAAEVLSGTVATIPVPRG